jgi:hypothetical protein
VKAAGLVVLAVAACGGGAANEPHGPVSNTAKPVGADPHELREAMVEATITALRAGDLDGLVALVGTGTIAREPTICETRRRADLRPLVSAAKGARIELLEETFERPERESRRELEAGKEFASGCVASTSLPVHEITVQAKIDRGGKERTQRLHMKLVEHLGKFYLAEPPDLAGNDALAKMRGFTDRMCACKDKACADQVQDDMTKWGMEMARNAKRDERPDPDMIKESGEIMTRYTECFTKLMTASMTP